MGTDLRTAAVDAAGPAGGRVTITEVAEAAGVSIATVSRVINRKAVAAATRERVEQAIADLGYVVNAHARALAGSTNRTVGIIIQDVVDPFYGYIARGVEAAAARTGRLCLVCCSRGRKEQELAFVDLLHQQRADAVVLVGGAARDRAHEAELAQRARALDAGGSSLVLCGRPPLAGGAPAAVVSYDNEGGAHALTDYLIERGHRRIAMVGGRPDLSVTRDRLAGYRRALERHGLPYAEELVRPGEFGRQNGYDLTRELLASGAEFTALFAGNDITASGAALALEEAGLRIPQDVSLVGYDDVPAAHEMRPALTTVHIPLEEMGRQAVRLSVGDGEDDYLGEVRASGRARTIRVATHIVERDSVAGPRRGTAP
ncbi:LacI family transcriptional regulator [Mangrovactinospora gilvigrisea]|uniref:LacI family transcriptional regulator n=1 Tax=Mangrovactinospora gilvigrisea TaxID=1428644 RepID=A0A1J7C6J7_9ACTN|nr:LacI family DNA-binding transcriptional regulator [Mangrovactinospora gilvigrisea]OIV35250.1 LacI family transcriptional regulator [Mangrovactinospora gilvigrisea]